MLFSNKDRHFIVGKQPSDAAAERSLRQAYDDVIDAGISVFEDARLSRAQRNGVLKAVAFCEETIDRINDALAPLDPGARETVLSQIENLFREGVDVAYAVAITDAGDVLKAKQAEIMRAAKTSPERERAIAEAISCSDPSAKKRVRHIIVDVAKAGFSIKSDAVRERLKKAGS